VSSLKTAWLIRREELHAIDTKAETIERRMLQGVMNQSRVLQSSTSNFSAADLMLPAKLFTLPLRTNTQRLR
jgi:hypothetical protein